MPVLVKVSGEPAGQLIELRGAELSIGRLPECDIVLDPNGVSRKHALIRKVGDRWAISDLNSRNKTKVNEVELPPDPHAHELMPGDRINICDVEFVFYLKYPPPALPKAPWPDDGMTVVEGVEDSTIHTLDASKIDHAGGGSGRAEVKLRAILEITRNLSTSLEIEEVAPKVLQSLMDSFPQAERSFLVLMREGDERLANRKTFHRLRPEKRAALGRISVARPADEARLSISRSIINHVMVQKKAVLSQDAGNDQNLPTSASIADLRIRSVMCAPLLTPDGQALGILQLDTSDRKQFGQDDLDLLAAVAGQAAIALQNATLHEGLLARERIGRDLRLAEQVQKGFLPKSVPKVAGYEFFAYYNAAYEVGGDYYDFVPLPDGRLAVALGDVSGKGVAAALMMAKFSGDTRYCILTEPGPGAAAVALNELLCAAGIEEKFITLSLGVLDPAKGVLTLCSAGHMPVLVRRAAGGVEEVGGEIGGFPLGVFCDQVYREVEVALRPGDVVVVHSDGVTDARSPEGKLYDATTNRRLLRRVGGAAGGPEAVGRSLLQEVREFAAGEPQADDITLICFGPAPG